MPLPKDEKSKFLARAGYTLDNWKQLERDLRAQVLTQPAERIETTRFIGMLFVRVCEGLMALNSIS